MWCLRGPEPPVLDCSPHQPTAAQGRSQRAHWDSTAVSPTRRPWPDSAAVNGFRGGAWGVK
eukprot:6396466-Prymnesium_polylepis.1